MKPFFKISLMCMDFLNIAAQIEVLNEEFDGYHMDIMDGHFCKNITLSPDIVKAIGAVAKKPMDIHLMTTTPNDWIDSCAAAGAQIISPHAETINSDAFRIINKIKGKGCKAGVTLNPATPLTYCREYLGKIDYLTIMTVDVGFAGQPFIPEMLDKIREAKKFREMNNLNFKIMIDGSCNKNTFGKLHLAGADGYVLGSSGLFSLDPDLRKACKKAKEIFMEETGVKL